MANHLQQPDDGTCTSVLVKLTGSMLEQHGVALGASNQWLLLEGPAFKLLPVAESHSVVAVDREPSKALQQLLPYVKVVDDQAHWEFKGVKGQQGCGPYSVQLKVLNKRMTVGLQDTVLLGACLYDLACLQFNKADSVHFTADVREEIALSQGSTLDVVMAALHARTTTTGLTGSKRTQEAAARLHELPSKRHNTQSTDPQSLEYKMTPAATTDPKTNSNHLKPTSSHSKSAHHPHALLALGAVVTNSMKGPSMSGTAGATACPAAATGTTNNNTAGTLGTVVQHQQQQQQQQSNLALKLAAKPKNSTILQYMQRTHQLLDMTCTHGECGNGQRYFLPQAKLGVGGFGEVWQVEEFVRSKNSSSSSSSNQASTLVLGGILFSSTGKRFALKLALTSTQELQDNAADSPAQDSGNKQQPAASHVPDPPLLEQTESFYREFNFMTGAQSPNILSAYSLGHTNLYWQHELEGAEAKLVCQQVPCMVLELAIGSLASWLHRQHMRANLLRVGLAPAAAAHFVRQLLLGLRAAHSCGIIHRDIKAENLLLAQAGSPTTNGAAHGHFWPDIPLQQLEVKVTDFGIAFQSHNYLVDMPTTQVGTRHHKAPELNSPDALNHSWHVDVFSAGTTYLQIRFGVPPFCHLWEHENKGLSVEQRDARRSPAELERSSCCYNKPGPHGSGLMVKWAGGPLTDMEKDWLRLCLAANPCHRASVDQLLQHPLMAAAAAAEQLGGG